jgi:hypothetical protein
MRVLAFALLLAPWACSPVQIARDGADRPDWVARGASGKYPDGLYLAGVGSGDTRADASDRARAEIAKRFKVAVHQDVTAERSMASSEDASGSAWVSDSSTRETTRTTTDQTLEDVQVAETWTDPGTARVYALATLHRGTAAERLVERLSDLDGKIEASLADATAAAGLRALGHVLEARALLNVRESLREPLSILDGSSWTETAPTVSKADLDRRIADLAATVTVAIEVGPPGALSASDVRSALSRAVTRGALQRVDDAATAAVIVRVTLDEQPVARANRDFAFWSLAANIELTDVARARVIGAARFEHREGALDERDARLRASAKLQDEVVASFFENMREFFKN